MPIEYFCCYHDYHKKLARLSDQEVGRLFRALLLYSATGSSPELAGRESIAFDFIAAEIDRAKQHYEERRQLNFENGKRGGRPKNPPLSEKAMGFLKSEKSQEEEEEKEEEERKGIHTAPAIALPLKGGREYAVFPQQCQEWAGLYPAVNILQQLRHMRGWLLANPARQKAKAGVQKFITGWLAREQNASAEEPFRRQGSYDIQEVNAMSLLDIPENL